MRRRLNPVKDIQKILASGGNRWTKPRREVLAVFTRNTKPLTPSEAHKRLPKGGVDLASVYRTINLFCDLSVLVPVDRVGKGQRYELSDAHRPHHSHLICNDCGRVEDFQGCVADRVEKRILRQTRFQVARHDLRFFGHCGECAS